ncbi:MAG: hypothetical protein R3A45_02290 [Bdellovibrionota bacterium]
MKKIITLFGFLVCLSSYAMAGTLYFDMKDANIEDFLSNPTIYINSLNINDFGSEAMVSIPLQKVIDCFQKQIQQIENTEVYNLCDVTRASVEGNYVYKKATGLSLVYVDSLIVELITEQKSNNVYEFSCSLAP